MAKCMIKMKFNSVDRERNRLHVGIKEIGLQRYFSFRRWGLEILTFCNKFCENPLIYKKVIEV